MRKLIKYFAVGLFFGIVLIKGEVVSWFRIQEMFHFQSIHMFGVIGGAVVIGAITVVLIRVFHLKAVGGGEIDLTPKPFNKVGNLAGGIIFGAGWALTGACPGPLYALVGAGYVSVLLAIVSSLLGVMVYGYLKPSLPH